MKRAERGVVFFFSGEPKPYVLNLLLGNVLPFENNVEGKSCVRGFEMLWLSFFFFFFLFNFIDSLFSVIGGNAPQSFNPAFGQTEACC